MNNVVNLQRKVNINLGEVRSFVSSLTARISEAEGSTFAVAFVSGKRMRELNSAFRGKDVTTDVLSFPYQADAFEPAQSSGEGILNAEDRFLGDIVISAEQAQKQAAENGLSLDLELKQLILHGVLHLCGYDHEIDDGEMNAREIALRDELGI